MQLFFNPNILENTKQLLFSKDESKHIIKVLRKQVGDILHITNGNGGLFEAEIILADAKQCVANIILTTQHAKRNYTIHLAVAPTKTNDRYEWFLEKATEIGIDSITPIICDNSERKIIKPERYKKILQSALKQSLQYYLPVLHNPVSFKTFIEQPFSGQRFIAHCENTHKKSLKTLIKPQSDVLILIGPEGDFSENEINLAKKNQYVPVTLGQTRLRTETAAIIACYTAVLQNE